jgi:hypothetical protein
MPDDIAASPLLFQRISHTINTWKGKLLDLSKRNRALNFKVQKVSTVTIIDEHPAEIFKLLCLQGKLLKFLPILEEKPLEDTESEIESTALDAEDVDNHLSAQEFALYNVRNLAGRHIDEYLQTNATPDHLDKSLRRLEEQAHLIIEEQGVNALFLSDQPSSMKPALCSDLAVPARYSNK